MDFDSYLARETNDYLDSCEGVEVRHLIEYVKENYKEVGKGVFQDEDSELFTIDEDADYINNEGWAGYKTLIEEPCEFIGIINELADCLASVKLELKTLKEANK
mgnify:CR=1 FL=1